MRTYKHELTICSWNIQGVNNKLEDESVLQQIMRHDIICLLETHCKETQELAIEGYQGHQIIRPKLRKAKRHSGGISVFVKKEIRKGIKFLKSET